MQDADEGDVATSRATLITAAEHIETVVPAGRLAEVVGDKGYHSNQELVDLEAIGLRSYISEPDRGRRKWKDKAEARDAVYRNRRRIRGARGQRLLRRRGGTTRTPLCPSLCHRAAAPRLPAGARQHPQTRPAARCWTEPWVADADAHGCRDTPQSSGACGGVSSAVVVAHATPGDALGRTVDLISTYHRRPPTSAWGTAMSGPTRRSVVLSPRAASAWTKRVFQQIVEHSEVLPWPIILPISALIAAFSTISDLTW